MTLYAIFGDIHGNAEALAEVLAFAERRGVEQLVCVGDIVGGNADPNGCVALLAEHNVNAVCGDHDAMVLERVDMQHCTASEAHALRRTQQALNEASRNYLASLPMVRVCADAFVLVHAELDMTRRGLWDSAAVQTLNAKLAEQYPTQPIAFFGHTHQRLVYRIANGKLEIVDPDQELALDTDPTVRYIISPGAVDSSRKNAVQRFAEMALFDSETGVVSFVRLRYNHELSEQKAQDQGYRMGKTERFVRWAWARARRRPTEPLLPRRRDMSK